MVLLVGHRLQFSAVLFLDPISLGIHQLREKSVRVLTDCQYIRRRGDVEASGTGGLEEFDGRTKGHTGEVLRSKAMMGGISDFGFLKVSAGPESAYVKPLWDAGRISESL